MQYFGDLSRYDDSTDSTSHIPPPPPPSLSGASIMFATFSDDGPSSQTVRTRSSSSTLTAECLEPLCQMIASGYEDIAEEAVSQFARLSLYSANHAALRNAGVIRCLASLITQPSGPVVSTLAILTLTRTMENDADDECIKHVLREVPDMVPALVRLCSVTVRPSEMAVRRSSLRALCELLKRGGEGAQAVTDCGGETVFRAIAADSCENSVLRECAQTAVSRLHRQGETTTT